MPPSFPFHMTVFFQLKPDYLPILQQEIFITTIVLHYDQCHIFFYSLFVLTPQQNISITAKYRHLKNSVLIYAKLSCLKIKPSSNKKCTNSLNCRGKRTLWLKRQKASQEAQKPIQSRRSRSVYKDIKTSSPLYEPQPHTDRKERTSNLLNQIHNWLMSLSISL